MYASQSQSCVTRSGKPRKGYYSSDDAEDGADYVFKRYKKRMVPYLCENCGDWHLCPAKRHTPSQHCDPCSKQAYESKQAAERREKILVAERGIWLFIYECPHKNGWHLTSMSKEDFKAEELAKKAQSEAAEKL